MNLDPTVTVPNTVIERYLALSMEHGIALLAGKQVMASDIRASMQAIEYLYGVA